MKPQTVYLHDYQPPAFWVSDIDLLIQIFDDRVQVHSTLTVKRNPQREPGLPLVLQGVGLTLQTLQLDGQNVDTYQQTDTDLTLPQVPDRFQLSITCQMDPYSNTSLEGLYQSGSMLCTQCEAEGFRKITYALDRPDVLSRYRTRIEAEATRYPTLLCNGNLIDQGSLPKGRHYAVWQDPFAKPSYLFALVAGDLSCRQDHFTTASNKEVTLQIFVEAHNIDKTEFALGALKRAMRWDEQRYGLQYDLDVYMIVASDFFNMGAMENKGLNIFNSALVLADPRTATDQRFEQIEAVIAHEYFHNWSGNRVTCRDWFQLSLKEGFTVFRDSCFTADMQSAVIKRIQDVNQLRSLQFAEDAGPMAHAVRPQSYMQINNFYTLTVYEKGAELVRMLHQMLGEERFRRGSDRYFQRFDGQAVTTDDFVDCMQAVSPINLHQFRHWYDQAGTPRLTISDQYDAATQRYHLTVEQFCPATLGQPQEKKVPLHIPLALGLLDASGEDLPLSHEHSGQFDAQTQVLHITQRQQTFVFDNIPCAPLPSLLRDFSAPVIVEYAYTD